MGAIGSTGAEFHIPGRTFHEPRFPTESGRARLAPHPIPRDDEAGAEDRLRLMTVRSEGQFNTVVYEEEDLYRGNTHRNVVMIAEADAKRIGLTEGSPVRVSNEVGQLDVEAAIVDIAAGCAAMYYPEANVLVPQEIDPESKTPAFKSVCVRLTPL